MKTTATPTASFRNVEVAASSESLHAVAALVDMLRYAERNVFHAQTALDEATAVLNDLQLKEIPEAMQAAGLSAYKLLDGATVEVKDDIKVNIANVNAANAYAWLIETGHGGSIKTQLIVDLRGTDEQTEELLERTLTEAQVEHQTTQTIHNATLKSLVKEMLEKGIQPPPSISVFQFKKAVIKEAKGKR